MKKNILRIVTLATVLTLAGCGSQTSDETKTESSAAESTAVAETYTPLHQMDLTKLVTLGDYKNLTIEVDAATVSDNEVEELMSSLYVRHIDAENGGIVDRPVAVGDIAVIDYEGKKDGVAFAGGTAQGSDLTIGSGQFIDGFEDGLIGVMPGETVDLNLTFPENYGNAELAGQAVVFTVKVNFIRPAAIPVAEMDDALIADIGLPTVTDVDSYKKYIKDYLQSAKQQEYDQAVESAILNKLIEESTIAEELPDAMLQDYTRRIMTTLSNNASGYGVSAEEYCNYFYGMSATDTAATYGYITLEQNLILQAIANEQNLNLSDEELDAELQSRAQMVGLSSVEEYLATASAEEYREYFMGDAVMAYLRENTTIVEK